MKTTPAFFQVQLGVDMDLEPYREQIKRLNFIYPYPEIDRAMANFPNGNVEEAAYYLYVATFHQPEMAPPGQHSLKLECPTRLDAKGIDWERDKDVDRRHLHPPRRGDHPRPRQARRRPGDPHAARPAARHRQLGGAFAGWAFMPELLTRARPKQRTPVPGLYLAGHWTTPTAGVPWVMVSGYNTAGMVYADLRSRGSFVRGARSRVSRERAAVN